MSRAARRLASAITLVVLVGGCDLLTEPTPTPGATATPSTSAAAPSVAPSATAAGSPSVAASATPEPETALTLELPESRDPRVVSATISPAVDEDGGEILVSVTSAADTRIDDLVVRWPEALGDVLFLAPFIPSDDRIRDGGDPLVQPWTKWVIGPGEHGEPAGTISLGYGPLLPGSTLDVRIFVDRVAPGPVTFDVHLLAGNDLLTLAGGEPATFRVEIP